MPVVNPEKLIALQHNADEVRNVRLDISCEEPSNTDALLDMYSRTRRKSPFTKFGEVLS